MRTIFPDSALRSPTSVVDGAYRHLYKQYRTPFEIDNYSGSVLGICVIPDPRWRAPQSTGLRASLGDLVVRRRVATATTSGHWAHAEEIFRIDMLMGMDRYVGMGFDPSVADVSGDLVQRLLATDLAEDRIDQIVRSMEVTAQLTLRGFNSDIELHRGMPLEFIVDGPTQESVAVGIGLRVRV